MLVKAYYLFISDENLEYHVNALYGATPRRSCTGSYAPQGRRTGSCKWELHFVRDSGNRCHHVLFENGTRSACSVQENS